MYKKFGYVRVASLVPKLEVANVDKNVEELINRIKEASDNDVNILVTPELSITGYTSADLFYQDVLIEESLEGLKRIVNETKDLDIITVVGLPIQHEGNLFNCSAVIGQGKILGIIPKTNIRVNESRWFKSSKIIQNNYIRIDEEQIPFRTDILFQDSEDKNISFGIEIGEDTLSKYPTNVRHTINGATIICNPAASNEIIGRNNFRKNIISNSSLKTNSAYIYASSGIFESTTDLVFSGSSMIYENGKLLKENERFNFNSNLIIADVDVKRLINERSRNNDYIENTNENTYKIVEVDIKDKIKNLNRKYAKYPFVPEDENKREERCKEIIEISSCALARRLLHTRIEKCVLGISGGLDSTLALLITLEAFKKINLNPNNIIAVTMPGFGTTDRTYDNACELVNNLNATLKEVDIKKSCIVHYKDIEHDMSKHDITYENVQARERTQILMDIANKENALVVGTGDLSELALGWCTYNGDHMSMYGVNTSIPKTLIKHLVKYFGDNYSNDNLKDIIYDIIDTPISPELLPPEKTEIKQKTEDTVGPYMLHDFFIYHMLRYGASPDKIYFLAKHTFKEEYTDEEIKKWLLKFIERFFKQQFKRSCMPDGPKVGTIGLSPRGDLNMPSDAVSEVWVKRLKNL